MSSILTEVAAWTLKDRFEVAAFVATILMTIFAWYALKQIKQGASQLAQSEKALRIESRRDALKISMEICQAWAEEISPQLNKLHLSEPKYPINKGGKWTMISDDEMRVELKDNKTLQDIIEESKQNNAALLNVLNLLEGKAMAFMTGVADEGAAFRPLAPSFVATVERWMPVIIAYGATNGLYAYTLGLWKIWRDRLAAQNTAAELAKLKERELTLKQQQAQTKIRGIKPLGS